jgi:hypothetical protein
VPAATWSQLPSLSSHAARARSSAPTKAAVGV